MEESGLATIQQGCRIYAIARTLQGGDNMTKREFLDIVFDLAPTEANRIMDAFDEYVESTEPHWIPVTERLPEEPFGCFVTVMDTNPMTMEEFENILPYFVGWDGEQWNDADGEQCPFEVIAWWGLPEPYKGATE